MSLYFGQRKLIKHKSYYAQFSEVTRYTRVPMSFALYALKITSSA